MRVFSLIGDWIGKLATGLGVFCMTALMVLVTLNIFGRFVFGVDLELVEELSVWLMLWVIYLMAGPLLRTGAHIAVDILTMKLTGKAKHLFHLVSFAVTLVFGLFFFWYAYEAVAVTKLIRLQTVSTITVPLWIVKLCLPLGMFFFVYFALEQLLLNLIALVKGGEKC